MDDGEEPNHAKRPRPANVGDDFKQIAAERKEAYDALNEKFYMLVEENKKLRNTIEDLLGKFDSQFSGDDNLTSEEDMVVDGPVLNDAKGSKKQKKNKGITKAKNNKHLAKGVRNNKEGAAANAATSNKCALSENRNATVAPENQPMWTKESEVSGSSQPKPTKKDDPTLNLSKSKHIPVITGYNINVREMTFIMDRALGHNNYNLKIMGKNATNIGVCTLEDFEKVKKLLVEHKINYYTYTPKGLRPYTLVLEGLSGTYDVDDVRSYLSGLQIKLDINRLVKLEGNRWLLQLSRESDVEAFYRVRYILHCRVGMRKFKRGAVTQCFNCQRFGHTSANCHMPYRCVKCGGSHGPGNCSIPDRQDNVEENLETDPITGRVVKRIGLPVRCVNCGVDGHAASSKQCPRRIELLRKIEARKTVRGGREIPRSSTGGGVRAGVSYASALAANVPVVEHLGVPTSGRPPVPSGGLSLSGAMAHFDVLDGDCKRLFGGGFLSCLGKIGGFAREYRTLGDDEGKSRALLGMLMALQHHG